VNERLLQFIWQFQYFNKTELRTTKEESIQVISPGLWNNNQGPDFLDAKIRVNNTLWVGTVEVHVLASDWERHHHEKDRNYHNVILHVVWENDETEDDMPVLELTDRVPKLLFSRYRELMHSTAFIPCQKSIGLVNELIWSSWKERLLAERLLNKAQGVKIILEQNNFHWEETCWRLLARNFGIKINADAFEEMAKSIPLKLTARLKNELFKLEALLLGQAGLLDKIFMDNYPNELKKEYLYLQKTHQLRMVYLNPVFLRLRPGSFPTLRLAQLAALLRQTDHFFSRIREVNSLKAIRSLLTVTASEYWDTHYRFDEISPLSKKRTGTALVESIIINTLVPLLFYYGDFKDDNSIKDKAILWLEETPPEHNSITAGFSEWGIFIENAWDSQAMVELKTRYCDKKRCLDCAVGNYLLRKCSHS
jgi:hypothetical protein